MAWTQARRDWWCRSVKTRILRLQQCDGSTKVSLRATVAAEAPRSLGCADPVLGMTPTRPTCDGATGDRNQAWRGGCCTFLNGWRCGGSTWPWVPPPLPAAAAAAAEIASAEFILGSLLKQGGTLACAKAPLGERILVWTGHCRRRHEIKKTHSCASSREILYSATSGSRLRVRRSVRAGCWIH